MSVITTNLYKLYRKYYSTDSGETWTPLNEYGYFLKEESAAQCMPIEPQYRWVDDGDEFICSGSSGYDKYQQEKEQVSLDSGVTWSDVSPKETRIGSLIEVNSEDCGYVPPVPPTPDYKARLTLTGGTTVNIPWDGTTVLGNQEIGNYSANAVSAIVYSGVTSIGNGAFYNFYKLSSVTIPDSVTYIGHTVFSNCSGLTSVTIPSGVTFIGYNAFINCTSISSVTIPDSVIELQNNAFKGCTSITSVTIGSGVTDIDGSTFQDCIALTTINIPDNITDISISAFQGCTHLTSVTIGSGVTEIGNQAFQDCIALTSITIPNSVDTIYLSAFKGCTHLTSATIGDGVTVIGQTAFSNCTGLTSVVIGSGLTSVSKQAFSGCSGLSSVTCYATTAPTLGAGVFYKASSTGTLYVPSGSDYSSWNSSLGSNWTIQYI